MKKIFGSLRREHRTNGTKSSETEVESAKVNQLASMFKHVRKEVIRQVLNENDGDVDRSVDFLLNLEAFSANSTLLNPKQQPKEESPYHKIERVQTNVEEKKTLEWQLMQAAKSGNVVEGRNILNKMKDNYSNQSLDGVLTLSLLIAIEHANEDMVGFLCKNGAHPDKTSSGLSPPLVLAIQLKQYPCVLRLLECGANPCLNGPFGSPLSAAVLQNSPTVFHHLIAKGADIQELELETGRNLLHLAVVSKNFEITNKLLQHIDLGKKDKFGENPLHRCLETVHEPAHLIFFDHLMKKASNRPDTLNSQITSTGETLMHRAIKKFLSSKTDEEKSMAFEILEILYNHFCDPNIKDHNGQKPIDILGSASKSESNEEIKMKLAEYMKVSYPNRKTMEETQEDLARASRRIATDLRQSQRKESSPYINLNKKDDDFMVVFNFRKKIEELLEENGFADEYQEIENITLNDVFKEDFSSSFHPWNMRKNRYKNVLPIESTRVRLKDKPNINGSDFINANYVSGEVPGSEKAYICTQGPLHHTVGDFWRMVWEHDCSVIVMLANEIENGRQKVYRYWPDQEPLFVDDFKLSLLDVENKDQYLVRKIKVHQKETSHEKVIYQFQYTGWPDQGLPTESSGFTNLIDDVNSRNETGKSIVVHCSAGIGRTGTFCIVHSTLAKLRFLLTKSHPFQFDIKETLLTMRKQRIGLVQTQEQYVFCFLSLLDKLIDILQVLEYKNEIWFHKDADSKQAIQLLKSKREGTFLFRPSSEEGHIVVSAVNEKNVVHARIAVQDDGFVVENKHFPSLLAVVEYRKNVLKNPLTR